MKKRREMRSIKNVKIVSLRVVAILGVLIVLLCRRKREDTTKRLRMRGTALAVKNNMLI